MKKDDTVAVSILAIIPVAFTMLTIFLNHIVAKIIFGILALLCWSVIIVIITECIKKKRREKRFINNMLSGTSARDIRRNILTNAARTFGSDYGYTVNNPIMAYNIATSKFYLEKLRTFDGQAFTWSRQGSICLDLFGAEAVCVDEYQLYVNGTSYKKIYICPYGNDDNRAPEGMILQKN